MSKKKVLIVCTTDSMIWNFLIPHIKQLESLDYLVECASSITGDYFYELENKFNIKMHNIDFARSPYSFSNFFAFFSLKKLIHQQSYDVIFCHEPVGGMMGRLVGKCCHKKVVYMAHGLHFFLGAPLKHWILYYTAEYFLSFLTDAFITINKEDYCRAKKMHAKRNYYVHGIGLQSKKNNTILTTEQLRGKYNIKNDDVLLIAVGELSYRKNHEIILKALKILADPKYKLLLCGDGELERELKEKCNTWGLQNNVIFTGFVKNVGDYLKSADIFIYPSLWEGLGIAALEAMDIGLPIIGANRRGIKDYVLDHKTGLLFEPTDAVELAKNIQELVVDSVLRNKLIKNSKKMVDLYGLDHAKDELQKIYLSEFN